MATVVLKEIATDITWGDATRDINENNRKIQVALATVAAAGEGNAAWGESTTESAELIIGGSGTKIVSLDGHTHETSEVNGLDAKLAQTDTSIDSLKSSDTAIKGQISGVNASISDLYNKVQDVDEGSVKPTDLKTLTVSVNGTQVGEYDTKTDKTINITADMLGLSGAMSFKGVTKTVLNQGSTEVDIIMDDDTSLTVTKGDVVIYGKKEFVWTGVQWQELGDEQSFALKSVTVTGTGYLTGGGSLEANRTIDIASSVKTKIDNGDAALKKANALETNLANNYPTKNGTGASGTWGIDISGKAASADKVANALTFNSSGAGAASGSSFDGSATKTISYNTIGAAKAVHSHAFSDITGKPTTLDGYGITDGVSDAELSAHANNTDIHLAVGDRENIEAALVMASDVSSELTVILEGYDTTPTLSIELGKKADASTLTAHTGNTEIHTTSAEKAKLAELGQEVKENAIYDSSAIYEQDETLLDTSSPYYVSYLDSVWLNLGINNGKITSNQYTGNYRLYLFNLPAGKYNLRLKADTTKDVGAIFATIDSEADFVVGTQTTVLFSGDGTDQSHIVDFAKDTLLIFESLKANFYNFGSVSEVKSGTLKGKVAEHDSRISQLENAVFTEGPIQDSELVMGIVRADGTLATYDTEEGYWRSDYIYCKGMTRVNFSKVANNKYLSSYAIYDENKKVLQKVVGESGATTNQDYDVDLTQIPGAFYLAFSITTATKNAHNWSVTVKRSRIEDIENQIKPLELEILIPDTIFAIVGTELNLWNDAVSLSVDNSLYSPRNYVTEWVCNKGIVTKRGYRYTPTASDSGNSYSCKCTIFDSINHVQIATKVFTIKVLAKNALSSAKNIVHFGDSLGENTAAKLYDNFNDSARYTGSIPRMLGTRGTGQKRCEAVGGWTWASYATAGVTGYRIYVSGVSSMSVGAIYTDGNHNFEVYEVNISDGNGNCLLGPHFTNYGTLIMPSGTLSKVSGSGDNSVPYTDAFQESVNPLWNESTNKLDLNHYKQTLVSLGQLNSVSDKIDAVSFQFGVNESLGSPNLITILNNYIIPLYNLFVNDNPNCKFIVGLTTSAGNDVDGAGANYGASRDIWGYLRNTYNFRKMYIEELQNNVNYPNLIIAPSELLIDRYYGYGFSTRQISQRTTETEQYHNNFVHPGPAGYGQLADALFATYIGALIGRDIHS